MTFLSSVPLILHHQRPCLIGASVSRLLLDEELVKQGIHNVVLAQGSLAFYSNEPFALVRDKSGNKCQT